MKFTNKFLQDFDLRFFFQISRLFLLSVIGLYFAFYLPIFVNYYVKYSWQFYGLLIFEILMTSNGIATPLVYAWHSETFKQKMLEMYGLRTPQTISSSSRNSNEQGSSQLTYYGQC